MLRLIAKKCPRAKLGGDGGLRVCYEARQSKAAVPWLRGRGCRLEGVGEGGRKSVMDWAVAAEIGKAE